ncbi:MAG TPA: hypothetical protein PKA88_18120 [Polyangiaceae bacterium]|nr:hypothetical protein [Polyangiaceae bacterium]HMR77683.1 hypothetical protein [Polyangiaceae bacterium]
MESRTALWVGVLLAAGTSACRGEPRALEPRTPPPRVAPNIQLPAAPIAPHHARVVLHSTDDALKITARADTAFVPPGHPVPPNRTGELCTTPCVTDLPIGRYKLFMSSADGSYDQSDTDTLEVREGLNYYLRAPGKFEEPTWIPVLPTVLTVLGVAAIAGGTALASDSEDTRTTGLIIAGGGLALTITGGVLMYDAQRGAIQKGATTTWTEPMGGQQ